jgi:hypothetical protein
MIRQAFAKSHIAEKWQIKQESFKDEKEINK